MSISTFEDSFCSMSGSKKSFSLILTESYAHKTDSAACELSV